MRNLGWIIIALLAVVIVISCTATVVQSDNTRKAVGQNPDAVENLKATAQDVADALENVEEKLEDGPVGQFLEELDNR
jgi:peptidoglycan hydrolase CwlO-like protein